MANYDYYKEHSSPSQSPKFGTFWLYAKCDFAKQNMVQADNLKIFQVKDKWVLLRSFWRNLKASTAAATVDVGTAAGGQEITAGEATNSAGDWTECDTLKANGEIALTADGYIYMECLTADLADGIMEIAIEVFAGPEDAEFDSLAE